jgi:hypothetical protein
MIVDLLRMLQSKVDRWFISQNANLQNIFFTDHSRILRTQFYAYASQEFLAPDYWCFSVVPTLFCSFLGFWHPKFALLQRPLTRCFWTGIYAL